MTVAERARTVAILAATGLVALSGSAIAQSPEAEVLFREGRNLIKQGKLEAGCDKLEASARVEPSVGTLLNLGDCREKLGRNASAWAAFRKAESLAKRMPNEEKRRDEAAKRATALEDKLTMLLFDVKQPVEGLVIKRDDEVVDRALWNTAIPVDPDTYTIVAEAPGYRAWRTEIPITAKLRRRTVSIPKLVPAPVIKESGLPPPTVAKQEPVRAPAPIVVEEPAAPPPTTITVVTPAPVRRGTWTKTRALSATLAVAGAGAFAGGAYYGMRANTLQRRADARCPLAVCDDVEGLRHNADANRAARNANVLFVGGGIAVAAATILWFVGAPSEHTTVAPAIGDGTMGVSFGGKF